MSYICSSTYTVQNHLIKKEIKYILSSISSVKLLKLHPSQVLGWITLSTGFEVFLIELTGVVTVPCLSMRL